MAIGAKVVQGTCAKRDWYNTLISTLSAVDSGWTQVSSNTTDSDYSTAGTDGYIFQSQPIGTQNRVLYMRIKKMTDPTLTNSSLQFRISFLDSYTPGTPGVNGTRGTERLVSVHQILTTTGGTAVYYPPDGVLKYTFVIYPHCIIIFAGAVQDQNGNIFSYLGYPELSSTWDNTASNQCLILNQMGSLNDNYRNLFRDLNGLYAQVITYNLQGHDRFINPLPNGKYMMFPFYIENSSNLVGTLEGFYAIMTQNLNDGDTITVDGDTYMIFKQIKFPQSSYYTFTSSYFSTGTFIVNNLNYGIALKIG